MVYRDPYREETAVSAAADIGRGLALPSRRLGAVMIDLFVVLTPLMALLTAPWRYQITAALLTKDRVSVHQAVETILFLGMVSFLIYHTLSLALWGRTIGKRFMGLRVVSDVTGRPPDFLQAFLRSFIWLISGLALGLPFLAVFYDPKRRPIYDRASETSVLAEFDVAAPPPMTERLFAKTIWMLAIVLVGLPLILEVRPFFTGATRNEVEEANLCPEMHPFWPKWPMASGQPAHRLDAAMSLYASGDIPESCLLQEADHHLLVEGPSRLAYLAKAMALGEDRERAEPYFKKVCDLQADSQECQFAHFWTTDDPIDEEELGHFAQQVSRGDQNHFAIWYVRYILGQRRYQEALDGLKLIDPRLPLGRFTTLVRTQAAWGRGSQPEALGAALSAFPLLGAEERIEVSGWLCQQILNSGCDDLNHSVCRVFDADREETAVWRGDPTLGLAFVRQQECRDGGNSDYQDLSNTMTHAGVRRLLVALSELQERKKIGLEGLRSLANDEGTAPVLRAEAERRLLGVSDNPTDLNQILNHWTQRPPDREWEKVGAALLETLFRFNRTREARQVFETLDAGGAFRGNARDHYARIGRALGWGDKDQRVPASQSETD